MNLLQKKVIHYPNLKTILAVDSILRGSDVLMTREELKRRLPNSIMNQSLNFILQYLEESGMIVNGRKRILWIYNPSSKLRREIEKGVEI